jgi:hypothetical protein
VTVVDPLKIDEIKKIYFDILKESSVGFNPADFKIAAMSSDDSASEPVTYVLPDFFLLDDLEKAQILIHEGLYRGRPTSDLRHVLQLDSALNYFKQSPRYLNENLSRTHLIDMQIALYNLKMYSPAQVFSLILTCAYSDIAKLLTQDIVAKINFEYKPENYKIDFFNLTKDKNGKFLIQVDKNMIIKKMPLSSIAAVTYL